MKDEESRDEYVPVDEYGVNLVAFARLIRTHQPAAKVAWLSSTPMHFDMHLNGNVIRYNSMAESELVIKPTPPQPLVDSYVDMYTVVTDRYD